jgi:hypothetical protein
MSNPCLEGAPPGLAAGIEEFNRGEYFECHETLEMLWRAEPRAVRLLYQGILQVGVALLKVRRRQYRAATILLKRGMGYLRPFAPACQGVNVVALLAAAERCEVEIKRLGPERLGEFDWSLAPRIDFGF